jgi:hypothetical protein
MREPLVSNAAQTSASEMEADYVCGSRKVHVDDHDIGTPAYGSRIKVKTVRNLLGTCLRMSERVLAGKDPVATA